MASDGHFPYRLFGAMLFLLIINVIGAGVGYGTVPGLTTPAAPTVCTSIIPGWCTLTAVWSDVSFVASIFGVAFGFSMVAAFNLTGALAFITYLYGIVNFFGWVIMVR